MENNGCLQINDIISAEEYQRIIYSYNQTDYDYLDGQTIVTLFEDRVKKSPNKLAIVFGKDHLTYAEVNARANQFARYLRQKFKEKTKKDIKPDTLVGLCLQRSVEMLVAILGILKADAAYVPIDPLYPNERIVTQLEDAAVDFVISESNLYSRFSGLVARQQFHKSLLPKFIILDHAEIQQEIGELAKDDLRISIQPKDLAYVIYTSGTTGKPKGVMIEHRNAVNYLLDTDIRILKHSTNVCFCTNIAFDLSITTTIAALVNGKSVFVYGGEIQDVDALYNYIYTNKIDTLKLVSSYAELLLRNRKAFALQTLIVGGEKLSKSQIKVFQAAGVKYLFDEYGPTETTVGVTVANVFELGARGIGKPIRNSKIYILDECLKPVATGVSGELYIGGAGVARGYLHQPMLTQQRFIANPFATEIDKCKGYTRLYKTGDLARWLVDGNIEYLGRIDSQVKINGYRIELEEIENALLAIPGIQLVTVQARMKKIDNIVNKYLVAYYVKEKNAKISKHEISRRLNQVLPSYMVPHAFIELVSFPLTHNGKLDHKSFPDQEVSLQSNYCAPANKLERKLCNVWKSTLGIKKIGITDDFFSIGGSSILSIILLANMRKVGFDFSIKDVFEQRTIANLLQLRKKKLTLVKINKFKKHIKRLAKSYIAKIKRNDVIYNPNDFSDYEPYVIFNYGVSLNPVFMFPPAGSGAETYFNNLVPELSNRSLVLFNNFYRYLLDSFGNKGVKHYTFEKLAAEYILLMKKIQPKGAYTLFGWSFGGVLAFEVARQLCLYGDKIDKLILINSTLNRKFVLKELKNSCSIVTPEDDINYCYEPKDVVLNADAKVILYKATKNTDSAEYTLFRQEKVTEQEAQQFALINQYYVQKTKDNLISNVLKHHPIQVIKMDTTHFDWIHNANIVKKIAATMLSPNKDEDACE